MKGKGTMSSRMVWVWVGVVLVAVLIVAYVVNDSSELKTSVLQSDGTISPPPRSPFGYVTEQEAADLVQTLESSTPAPTVSGQPVGPISFPLKLCFCRCRIPLGDNLCTIPYVDLPGGGNSCPSTTFAEPIDYRKTCGVDTDGIIECDGWDHLTNFSGTLQDCSTINAIK